MSADPGTLEFYNEKAADYAEALKAPRDMDHLARFMATLPQGAQVLDLGCGSAWAAHAMQNAGFTVTAMDGSQGLADQARKLYGIEVIVQHFDAITWDTAFDGIWAWFCLMHTPREAMDENLARVARALRPGGWLMLGCQEGDKDLRDTLGRHYSYYTEADMRARLTAQGLTVTEVSRRPGAHFDGTPSVEMACLAHA